jgi:hypothetical protein
LDVPAENRLDLDSDPELSAGIRVVAGEPRARYLHTLAGATDDVVATWRERLGTRARVLYREQAVALNLFGQVPAGHLPRIGDVVLICEGDTVVLAGAHEPDSVRQLVGFHGGLTPAETAIPLLAVTAM